MTVTLEEVLELLIKAIAIMMGEVERGRRVWYHGYVNREMQGSEVQ